MLRKMSTGQTERPAPEAARVEGVPSPAAEVEELFAQHHLRLLRALYLLTGSAAEAEDLLQEAFVKVWQRWERVRTMDDRAGYLYRTAMNAFRSGWRHRLVELRHPPRAATPRDPIETATERQAVLEALRTVPPRQRLAVVLADFLDRSPAEVASVLGVEEATARSLASQGRARVRRELEAADG
jgi:RNA polymerase sigma-70 factor (sigma-E family)